MKLELAARWKNVPRNANGDPAFTRLGGLMAQHEGDEDIFKGVLDVFGPREVVELVNRALYQLEYQSNAHRKYGKLKRAQAKELREELEKKGIDPTKDEVERQLRGDK